VAKQTINIGTTPNDGTGSTIRAGGDLVNDNFNEIYTALGDGSTLNVDTSGASNGEALVFDSGTGKFVSDTVTATSDFTVAGDGGVNQTITTGDTFTIQGGTGITTTGVATDVLSVAIDSTVATLTGSQVLTGKTINGPDNTLTNIANASLANDSVSFGGISLDLGGTDATPAFDLSDATNYPTSSLTGTITNAQLDGSIVNGKLLNSSITIRDDSSTEDAVNLGETLIVTGAGGLVTSVSGNTLTLTQASASLTYSKGTATGDGSTTAFTINSGRAEDDILVFVNGICLVPTDDYTISGTTLTFNTAPAVSAEITFRYLPI